jgi:excinuclease Cho
VVAYAYPEHLRAAIADMPAAPGVYIFHGPQDSLPLYIGKSVNLRSRVLAHLRNRREARLLRQTHRISHLLTAGEIGALLLEAQLIKERYPLLNRRLRRKGRLCSLRLGSGAPDVVYAQDIDFACEPELFGLFTSRSAALQTLRGLADEHRLCLGALGLERLPRGRACFRAMLGKCAGQCTGAETLLQHQQRLRTALEALALACWPHAGAIGLVEEFQGLRQIHVVRNWCYLGSVATLEQARQLDTVTASFDADSYRILCRPVLAAQGQVLAI